MKYILHLLLLTTLTLFASSEILKIKLNATSLELPEGNSTQLSVRAYYDNNTSKDVTPKVTWSIDNPQIASIDTNATLNAIQEGLAQITAELENITSQTLSLSVVKVINGHKLPPEPDPD
ncbi:Ig-like domain-containing protein, partial [Sulfurimonas sp.]